MRVSLGVLYLLAAANSVSVVARAAEESPARSIPAELVRFASPDGRFAFFMGWDEQRHYDPGTHGWVVDTKMEPAAIIERTSQKVLFAFDAPGRPDEDRALWSANSQMLAYSHRGDDITELRVFSCDADGVRELKLPYLGEVELQMKPRPRGLHPNAHEHLNHDSVLPVRWSDARTLVVSQERSVTDAQEFTYTRQYLVTLAFDAEGKATITKVSKQKQKTTGRSAAKGRTAR